MLKYNNTASEIKNKIEPATRKILAIFLYQIKTCNEETIKSPIAVP
jgi:hypothetical protein